MPRTKLHPPSGDKPDSSKKAEKTAKSPKGKETGKPKVEVTDEMIEGSKKIMPEIMDEFTPDKDERQSGTQSSFLEQKKRKAAEKKWIEDNLPEKLAAQFAKCNEQLRDRKTGVTLKLTSASSTVCLKATLPLKPGDTSKDGKPNKPYDISVNGKNFPYHIEGIDAAYAEAVELGALKSKFHPDFPWPDKYLGRKALEAAATEGEAEKPKTIGELLDEFDGKYFLKKKRCRQSKETFGSYLRYLNNFLQKDTPLSFSAIIDAIDKTETGSCNRVKVVRALSVFCNHFDFQFNFGGFADGYEPVPRILPKDDEVLAGFDKFKFRRKDYQWEAYQQIYGYLATYGLRPHEYFAIDWEKTLDASNVRNMVWIKESITDGTKTGDSASAHARLRSVFPLYPDWVEKFDLKNLKSLKSGAALASKVAMIAADFRRNEINFPPYNLRHAYAIRGHMLQYSVKDMADNMGHSYEVHTGTYQKYLSLEQREQAYDLMLARNAGKQAEASEVDRLLVECGKLKSERVESDAEAAAKLRLVADLLTQNRALHNDLQDLGERNRELQAQLSDRSETDNPEGLAQIFQLLQTLFYFLIGFMGLAKENRELKAENQRVHSDFIELAAKAEQMEVQLMAEREYRKPERVERVTRRLLMLRDDSSVANDAPSNERDTKVVTENVGVMNRKQLAERHRSKSSNPYPRQR